MSNTDESVLPIVRHDTGIWKYVVMLYLLGAILAYFSPPKQVTHLDGTPELLSGIAAAKTTLVTGLGLTLPAIIIAAIIAAFPTSSMPFSERWYRALSWTLVVFYSLVCLMFVAAYLR